MRWFRRILSGNPPHLVKLLRFRVPRFEFVIAEGPSGRQPSFMLKVLEVLLPVSYEDRSIEFGIAPNIIVVAGIERLAGTVEPGFLWSEEAFVKNDVGIAGFRTVQKVLTSF